MRQPDNSISFQNTTGDSAVENLYVYGQLNYNFDNDDLKVKSIEASESSTFKSDLIIEGNLSSTSGLNLTGDINIGGASGHVGLATFKDARFYGKIFDGDGDFGTSGQLLSSDGTDTVWIDASTTSVANANNVGTNLNSTNADQFITFVGASSGNNAIRVDADLTYNPSNNQLLINSSGPNQIRLQAGDGSIEIVRAAGDAYIDFKQNTSQDYVVRFQQEGSTDTIKVLGNLRLNGELQDGDNNFGSSGQVLSSDGTDTKWINAGSLTAGAASQIGVNQATANANHFITMVDTSSGNEEIRVDTDLTYNPVTNTLSATNLAGNGVGITGIEAFVTGMIILWYGNTGNIPTGFVLCDGNNSTPDLRDRFVVGAGSAYSPSDTGGSKDAVVVSHNHSASSSVTDPGHFHTTNNYVARSNYAEPRNFGVGTDGNLNNTGDTNSKTTGISVSTSVSSQGVSGTDKNLPPYYALCYIMKT